MVPGNSRKCWMIVFCIFSVFGLFSKQLVSDELNQRFHVSYPLKVLHISFHKGCIREVEGIAQALNLNLTSWYISDLPPFFFDPQTIGNALYNIGHDRAARIWEKHKNYFNTFDVVFISDTSPLARIFLQNNFKKNLIIWISDRFDYFDRSTLDCKFPDEEYYALMRKASVLPNVKLIGTCPFEHYYAKRKGVDTGSQVIKPCAPYIEEALHQQIPASIDKSSTFFMPSYHNETKFIDVEKKCKKLGISVYRGSFAGPKELLGFKGVIHLPYSWSTIALYVNSQLGLPYFVPSKRFMQKLYKQGGYWHQDKKMLFGEDLFALSEWYSGNNKEFITYFNSWDDLKKKIAQADFNLVKKKVQECALRHKEAQLRKWQESFETIILNLTETSLAEDI
jgi:hypothetical protein